MDTNNQPSITSIAVPAEAHRQFAALEPVIMNRDMITNAISELTKLGDNLNSNIDTYIAENGGEEEVEAAAKNGEHEQLPLARFKLELVRTTAQRFQAQLTMADQAVGDFVKV